MTHCTMDDFVALRANEGSLWARQHVDSCAACRAELEALYQRVAQLKALPAVGPARDRWPMVRGQVVATRARARRRWAVWGLGLAAAAAVAGVAVLRPFRAERSYASELAQAKQQSASLEADLQRYDPDARVESGRAAAVAAALEDRIAVVDAELGQLDAGEAPAPDDELVRLWRSRVNLMEQLVDVHVSRAVYVGL